MVCYFDLPKDWKKVGGSKLAHIVSISSKGLVIQMDDCEMESDSGYFLRSSNSIRLLTTSMISWRYKNEIETYLEKGPKDTNDLFFSCVMHFISTI